MSPLVLRLFSAVLFVGREGAARPDSDAISSDHALQNPYLMHLSAALSSFFGRGLDANSAAGVPPQDVLVTLQSQGTPALPDVSSEDKSAIPATSPPVSAGVSASRPFIERVWLYSHRSSTNDPNARPNRNFLREENETERYALNMGLLPNHVFCHTMLPEYAMKDPRWGDRYTEAGIRGRGYWFWKSAILEHMLSDASLGIQDGDWVIYADGDKHWLMDKMFNAAKQADAKGEPDIVAQLQREPEQQWTRGDVFGRFGVQPTNVHYGSSGQWKAQVFMLQINARTRQFVKFWVALCADYHLISGEESKNTLDFDKFRESREDQSLYSMLIKASKPGGCKEVNSSHSFPANDDDACIHPEFGIPGLTVVQQPYR